MPQQSAIAGNRSLFHHNAAVALDQGTQQRAVCVIGFSLRQRLSRFDRPVGYQTAHAWPANHKNACYPGGSERPNIGRSEPPPRRDQRAAAPALTAFSLNPASCNNWLGDDAGSPRVELDLLRANDGVGAVR